VPFTARTNTSGATREKAEPADCHPTGGTVWYRYRAKRTLGIVANTIGTTRAITLGVFEGTSLADLRTVACDTDAGGAAYVSFPAETRSTYYFQLTNPIGGGPLVFNLDPLGNTNQISFASEAEPRPHSDLPSISGNGRFVAFESASQIPGDKLGPTDIFVHDLVTKRTSNASVSSAGAEGDDVSVAPSMSADGRYVGFTSCASNLVPGDDNDLPDVFVHDGLSGATERVSVRSDGQEAQSVPTDARAADPALCAVSSPPSISQDGRFVAFTSDLTDLIEGDNNDSTDVFLHDRAAERTTRVSVSSRGLGGDCDSLFPSISADGRFVAFASCASNLVEGDANENLGTPSGSAWDVFVRDRATGTTTLVSVSSSGAQGDLDSWTASISPDGRYVGFPSDATNLVSDDTNSFRDAFVHDRMTGKTIRVSVSSTGEQQLQPEGPEAVGNIGFIQQEIALVAISSGGRYVAFESRGLGLVPEDDNAASDIFLHDRQIGTTVRVSVSSSGGQGNAGSRIPTISSNGHVLAFQSLATNLASGDAAQESWDVFVHVLPQPRSESR
ncbi:MAG: hypothetical protein ACRDH6_05595, partial [Actinomycetota bacterium]